MLSVNGNASPLASILLDADPSDSNNPTHTGNTGAEFAETLGSLKLKNATHGETDSEELLSAHLPTDAISPTHLNGEQLKKSKFQFAGILSGQPAALNETTSEQASLSILKAANTTDEIDLSVEKFIDHQKAISSEVIVGAKDVRLNGEGEPEFALPIVGKADADKVSIDDLDPSIQKSESASEASVPNHSASANLNDFSASLVDQFESKDQQEGVAFDNLPETTEVPEEVEIDPKPKLKDSVDYDLPSQEEVSLTVDASENSTMAPSSENTRKQVGPITDMALPGAHSITDVKTEPASISEVERFEDSEIDFSSVSEPDEVRFSLSDLNQSAAREADNSTLVSGPPSSLVGPSTSGVTTPLFQPPTTLLSPQAPVALIQIPEIVSDSLGKINSRDDGIVVQLDPPELGRVSIDFKFDEAGAVSVTVTGDSPEALKQLRLMHSDLLRAIENNGLQNSELNYRENDRRGDSNSNSRQVLASNHTSDTADEDPTSEPPTAPSRSLSRHSDSLDIRL